MYLYSLKINVVCELKNKTKKQKKTHVLRGDTVTACARYGKKQKISNEYK